MFCTRCDANVPDFLWIDNDHPVLLETPMTISQGPTNVIDNTCVITAQIKVHVRMCSDMFVVNMR